MNAATELHVGFAADADGAGVAYVRAGQQAARVLRVPFTLQRMPALQDREVGYAALHAVVRALLERRIRRVVLWIDDAALADDLREHREVPPALALAYVRLRCALNQFASYEIACSAEESDLTQRARAELALHIAA